MLSNKTYCKWLTSGSDIVVQIGYIHLNPVTLFPDIREMNFVMTVVPEVEATYVGGNEELRAYLEKNAIDKIAEKYSAAMKRVIIRFIVSNLGQIVNAGISRPSDDPEMDKLLLKVINDMPDWKPAENAEGTKIQQEFEFSVGNIGC